MRFARQAAGVRAAITPEVPSCSNSNGRTFKCYTFAAEHDKTLNAVVRELLTEALSRESRARAAADRLLALADLGPYFSADPRAIDRSELHERR